MEIKHVTKANFEAEVLKAKEPVIVDFWATWCSPCQAMGKTLETLAEEHPEIKICKINVDEEGELAQEFEVMSIPLLVSFKNGVRHKDSVGVIPAENVLELVK